jgi:ribonuclease Z
MKERPHSEKRRFPQYYYPGEPLGADQMRVTILGSGTPFPRQGQASAGILVEAGAERLIFDVGPGVPERLAALEIPMNELDKVFLTHLHMDHTAGLAHLWIGGWTYGRHRPIKVWGPPGADDFCQHLAACYAWDVHGRINDRLPPDGGKLDCREYVSLKPDDNQQWIQLDQRQDEPWLNPGVIYRNGELTITAFEVLHIQRGHAFAFRVDYKNRSFVFSGDTRKSPNLVSHAKGVDLIIHDSFPPAKIYAEKTGRSLEFTKRVAEHIHSSPAQAGQVFAEARPRLGILYHLYNNPDMVEAAIRELATVYEGPFAIGYDLMVINIGDELTVRSAVTGKKPWPVGIEAKHY